jgi:hypothetical protein
MRGLDMMLLEGEEDEDVQVVSSALLLAIAVGKFLLLAILGGRGRIMLKDSTTVTTKNASSRVIHRYALGGFISYHGSRQWSPLTCAVE